MLNKPDYCLSCVGCNWPDRGYVPADGTGENGVLIVGEAAGADEAVGGMPFIGKAGYFLFQQLARVGIQREGFRIHNVLSCRPPANKLVKMPYEQTAIDHCAPLLDATIEDMQKRCKRTGKHFSIFTLGVPSFKRIMGIDHKNPIMKQDYLCYPFWSDRYGAWVMAADHPSYLMQGNSHLVPVMQFAAQRILDIAENGLTIENHNYLLDPDPDTFIRWVRDYIDEAQRDPNLVMSYDIETPYKRGKGEDELAKEEDDDYTILRISFSYRENEAVSVRWSAEYMPGIEAVFEQQNVTLMGWNSSVYDDPRILAQVPVKGTRVDGMLAWHVLNSSLPKSLGSVTPFYDRHTTLWKHLSDSAPAFYNAKDADMALRCYLGIRRDLIKNKQWDVFQRHVIDLNKGLQYMSSKGVARDDVMRAEAEGKLTELLQDANGKMGEAVPLDARRVIPANGYKKDPKDTTGMVRRSFRVGLLTCSVCGTEGVARAHIRARKGTQKCGICDKKWTKAHTKKCQEGYQIEVPGNVCAGAELVEVYKLVERWAKPLEFKISNKGMQSYQSVVGHRPILTRREHKITFDEPAIIRLMKQYPNDPLYPLILDVREFQKLLSNYIGVTEDGKIRGGMPISRDGRIHTLFSHNPSTLRLASQEPNLQNLPRPNPQNPDDLANIIRNLIVAAEGCLFTARDFSGIEAVLVGYFARLPDYIRLAKMDVHSYYTAYALYELDRGRILANDLPQLSWPDERLIPHLKAIKKEFSWERNTIYKHLIHAANFAQTPKGANEKIFAETRVEHPVHKIARIMEVYFNLFPGIRKWQHSLLLQAQDTGYLRNPFGYVHRFSHVFKWVNGERKPGDDANKVVAFLPQSTAAGIMKEALLRLYFNRFEEAGQYLRLTVHDELLSEVPEAQIEAVDLIMQEEMERPVSVLPLPASYGMGEYLNILTEPKSGKRWGSMH